MRAHRHAPVDAFQQHRELRRCERDAAGRGLWPDEAATLEPLGQQHQSLSVEPQDLQDVAALATEDEDVAAERIGRERRLGHGSQTIEALPHVGVAGHDPHARVRGKADHTRCANASSAMPSRCASTWPCRRTRAP